MDQHKKMVCSCVRRRAECMMAGTAEWRAPVCFAALCVAHDMLLGRVAGAHVEQVPCMQCTLCETDDSESELQSVHIQPVDIACNGLGMSSFFNHRKASSRSSSPAEKGLR